MSAEVSLGSIYGALQLKNEMKKGADAAKKEVDSMSEAIEKRLSEVGGAFAKVGGVFTAAFTVPIVAGFGLAGKAALSFEDKLADVAKTTGLQGEVLEQFGKDLRSYSNDTRTSLDDLLTIAEIGGQLGIAQKDLLSFVKTIDKFNVALGADFAGGIEEAAAQIGKIQTLFKETKDLNVADSINAVGSAVNELGAQGAGTSANMTDFTLRLGQLPDALKPTIQDTLALATVLEEAGINAQVGSGGLTNFFLVAAKELPGFAKQMGLSADAAKRLLEENPTEFAKEFAKSLNGLSAEQLAKTLDDLGIGTQETIKVLGALGANTERLTELQNLSNEAFAEATSLQEEYNKKNATNQAEIDKLSNVFNNLAITLGNVLLPIINDIVAKVAPAIQSVIEKFEGLSPSVKTAIVVFAAILAAIGPILLGIGILISTIGLLVGAFGVISGVVTGFLAPLALIIAGIIAVVYAVQYLVEEFGLVEAVKDTLSDVFNRGKDILEDFIGVIDSVIDILKELASKWMENLNKMIKKLEPSVKMIGDAFKKLVPTLDFIVRLLGGIAVIVGTVLVGAFSGLLNAVMTVIPFMVSLFANAFDFIANIVQFVIKLFTGDFKGALDSFIAAIKNLAAVVINYFGSIFAFVAGFIKGVIDLFVVLYNKLVKQLIPGIITFIFNQFDWLSKTAKSIVNSLLNALAGIFNTLWNVVVHVFSSIYKFVINTFNGLWQGVMSIFNGIYNFIASILNSIWSVFKSIINTIVSFATGIFWGFYSSIQNIFNGIYTIITNAFLGAYGFIKKVIEGIGNLLSNLVSGGFNAAGSILNAFKNFINAVIDKMNAVLNFNFKFLGRNINIDLPDIPKFADGGIVGGNSYRGDKIFAAVNSGEMILNTSQQDNLGNMINGNALNTSVSDSSASSGNTFDIDLSVPVNGYIGTPMQIRKVAETVMNAIQEIAYKKGVNLDFKA